MATKTEKIESKEFKIWQELHRKTTVDQIHAEIVEKGHQISKQTIGNILRTGYATYKTYKIMAEHFGTLQTA